MTSTRVSINNGLWRGEGVGGREVVGNKPHFPVTEVFSTFGHASRSMVMAIPWWLRIFQPKSLVCQKFFGVLREKALLTTYCVDIVSPEVTPNSLSNKLQSKQIFAEDFNSKFGICETVFNSRPHLFSRLF